jgi:glutamate-1-semialdehyde aminotransferase
LQGTAVPFYYNDLKSFKDALKKCGNNVAGVVMEPVRNFWPEKEFINGIRRITKVKKIPLIFDEVTSGLRMNSCGIHAKLGINPDMAVFAKALGNGYPMAAVIGKTEIMSAAQKTFISSTYWTDRIGPAAAIATLKKHAKCNAGRHLTRIGGLVQKGWKDLAKKYSLNIHVSGIEPLSHWQIECADNQIVHTYIAKRMLEKGFLVSKAFYATYAHTPKHVQKYLKALDEVLKEVAGHIKAGTTKTMYRGPLMHSGFKRLN